MDQMYTHKLLRSFVSYSLVFTLISCFSTACKHQPKTITEICDIETICNKDGFQKLYFENDVLKAEGHFKNNRAHGFYKEFYSNGQLKVEGHFENGKVRGFVKHFDKEGVLLFEGHLSCD